MTTQTSYSERMRRGFPGQQQGSDYDSITGLCETAAGIGFGLAVGHGGNATEKGTVLGGPSENFKGVSIKDVTLVHSDADLDKYVEHENMGIHTRGLIFVAPSTAVAEGGAVHYDATTGVFKASGGELLQGAVWRSSALANEVALLYLPGLGTYAAT